MSKRLVCLVLVFVAAVPLFASEVLDESTARVVVRQHPKTGKPYVTIVSAEQPSRDILAGQKAIKKRPDYRLLDRKVKSKDVGYEGPYSDRKKVYILAASLATVGTVGGTAIIAAAPAATGAGAAGGAGVYAGAGAAVAAGTVGGTLAATRSNPDQDNYKLSYETRDTADTAGQPGASDGNRTSRVPPAG